MSDKKDYWAMVLDLAKKYKKEDLALIAEHNIEAIQKNELSRNKECV